MVLSEAVRRARWVEAEVVTLKYMGLSFRAIAEQITRVGRGQAQAITPIPDGVGFPPDYKISHQRCYTACEKALARERALGVKELRKIDHARTEEMWMNLQPAIRKGNPRAVEVGVKVLDHAEKINAYAAPRRKTPLEEQDDRISVAALRRIVGDVDDLIITPSQRLLTGVGDVPDSDGSMASGVAVGDTSAPRDDATRSSVANGVASPNGDYLDDDYPLPARFKGMTVQELRDALGDEPDEEEERMRTFGWLLKI